MDPIRTRRDQAKEVRRMRTDGLFETQWTPNALITHTECTPCPWPVMRIENMLFTREEWQDKEMPYNTVDPEDGRVLSDGNYTTMILVGYSMKETN